MTARELIAALQQLPGASLDATVVIDGTGVCEEVTYEGGEVIINPDDGDNDGDY